MKKIFHTLFFLGMWLCFDCQAQTTSNKSSFTHLDKIVAVVNREVITQSELNKQLDKFKKMAEHTNQPLPAPSELRKMAMDELIAKNLQMQIAHSKGMKVTDEEADKAIKNIAQSNNLTIEQLKQAVEQGNIKWEDYSAEIKNQILLQKVAQDELAKTLSLTPDDVKKFVHENKDKFNQYNAFHLIDVVVPAAENLPAKQVEEAKKQAQTLASSLQTGKNLDETLKQYPSAEKNDLGWRGMNEIPSLFQSKIASMKINSTTAPIQAPNGFHVLQLVEAKGDNIKPTEIQLKNMAFQEKMKSAVKDWVEKLKQDAYIKMY